MRRTDRPPNWAAWACVVFWAIVITVGVRTYRGMREVMEPTISAVQSVSERLR